MHKDNLLNKIEKILDYFTKNKRLPIEQIIKRMNFEPLEKEEYAKMQNMRELEKKAEEECKKLNEIRRENHVLMMPSIVRRKIIMKKKDEADQNEKDH